jgi:hypothetical protein
MVLRNVCSNLRATGRDRIIMLKLDHREMELKSVGSIHILGTCEYCGLCVVQQMSLNFLTS